MKTLTSNSSRRIAALIILIGTLSANVVIACPPHPTLMEEISSGMKQAPYYMENIDELRAKGVSTGLTFSRDIDGAVKLVARQSPKATGTFKALAIMVEFSDNASQVNATYFDSLLFDSLGNSVRNYYGEISYNQLDLVTLNLPTQLGWQTAPETYAYYVNGQNGTGSYPNNTQKLCEDLVDLVDGTVDFSQYDNDNDGFVDVVTIIHAGSGAEKTGSSDDIWSHKWGINPRLKDGVYISSYTIQPELWTIPGDMTIGVYAHELGHAFGLPDLYDTDATQSRAIGTWGIMAYGSWNGAGNNGGSPAHPCAWSRIQMGFATATNIATNTTAQPINEVQTSGEIYRLWTSGNVGDEYYLVENRQKTGYDSYLKNSGLLIWHIDDAKATSNNTDNTQEWWPDPGMNDAEHYRVALEQADGLWEMEKKLDYGDSGDPFPGTTANTVFDATTTPNSDSYTDGVSFVKVDNISSSGPLMTADLIVAFAADIDTNDDGVVLPNSMELGQNYPNPFNPSTTIRFNLDQPDNITLTVYNALGRKVRTLLDGSADAGETIVHWDGRNDSDTPVAAGVYLYRLDTEDLGAQVRKMVLIK